MSKDRDLRHRTTNLEKEFTKIRRKVSNKHGSCARDLQEQQDQVCLTPTSRQFVAVQFSNRDSGRINFSPLVLKNKQKYNLESAKKQLRSQLLKLSYKEKLIQIQSFFKKSRDLCKQYGYFTATFAMLTFNLHQTIKISVWIHPDHRSTKPLHPIKKKTPFQCQLICVNELKNLIKKIFPTIDLGSGKTFGNTIAHIQSLITQMNNRKNRAFTGITKNQRGANQNKNERKLINCQTQILKPIVNVSKRLKTMDEQIIQHQNNRNRFQIDERNKETMSTLLESIRSVNSIKERLKKELSKTPIERKRSIQNNSKSKSRRQNFKQRKTSWIQQKAKVGDKQKVQKKLAETLPHRNMQTFITNISNIKQQQLVKEQEPCKQFCYGQEDYLLIKAHSQPKQKQKQKSSDSTPMKNNSSTSRIAMKTSITGGTGKKPMSISIQMQSQINNLFGSSDQISLNNFYNQQAERRMAKNSILSKVAEEFQDLF